MKKIINIITLPVFILLPFYLQAHLSMAYDNPAYPLDCNWELIIPAVNFIADMDNSLISLDNLSIFDKDRYDNGHIMSDEEKEILTAGDLVLSGAFAFDILGVRYRQWGLKLKALAYFKGKILDKQYTEIALYGNETNKIYHFNAGKGAKGYGFFKAALNYNYPHAFDLVKLF
ncbi:MAG: hypothetical protein JXB60_06965, partial [Candidatus Cloacimonetes bacterium]|nr:hypothetical protein [Candidatus Cloacimonadota bacterium]